MPGFQQQQPMQRQFVPPPFTSSTRFSDITPPVMLTDEFCRRQLTSYEAQTFRKAEPINNGDFQNKKKDLDTKKQKKDSKRPTGPKRTWQRAMISQEVYDQDVILKKIKALDKKRSIADKKADLPPHMNIQVDKLLDEKNHFEYDPAFMWTLCQLNRVTVYNKTTKSKETDSLTVYLKRAPRPDLNATIVFSNIEKAKLRQNQPPPQQVHPQQVHPQQRASSQGPPQGQPKNPQGRAPPPPPPVEVVHDGHMNGGKGGGKGGQGGHGGHDEIQVIETGGPRRKVGAKTVYNRRKSVHYRSDDSRSTRSSRSSSASGSDSDTGSAYSDSETNPSSVSVSSLNRRRRDSGYARGKGRGMKQHEKGYFMVNKPRRQSSTAYVPDPPRVRAQSYERLSTDPIEVEHRISEAKAEAFAAGFTTASRVAAVDRTSMSPQRTIMYPDDRSQRSSLRSLDEDIRALDDTRAEVLKLENLRLQDDLRHREELRLQDLRLQEEANARLREDFRRLQDAPTREELRLRTDLRRAQDILRQDELPSPRMRDPEYLRRGSLSPVSFESMPPTRTRDFDYPRRGSLSTLPLDQDVPYQYVRNPFAPRRREPLYRD